MVRGVALEQPPAVRGMTTLCSQQGKEDGHGLAQVPVRSLAISTRQRLRAASGCSHPAAALPCARRGGTAGSGGSRSPGRRSARCSALGVPGESSALPPAEIHPGIIFNCSRPRFSLYHIWQTQQGIKLRRAE